MRRSRPDDGHGEAFHRALRSVEARAVSPPAGGIPDVVWRSANPCAEGVSVCLEAEAGAYVLSVVQVEEEFLNKQPEHFPEISWSVSALGRGGAKPLVGGPAPSVEVASARAETLWRALQGWRRS